MILSKQQETPSSIRRKIRSYEQKILAENLTFEETVQWGRTNEVSAKKVKDVEGVARKLEAEGSRDSVSEVNRVKEEVPKKSCKTCSYKHRPGQKCPGLSGLRLL